MDDALSAAVQNSHNRFFVPAATPIIFSICVIGSLFVGAQKWGALAIGFGVLVGGAAQILVQYPSYRKLGYRLMPSFNFSDPAFRQVTVDSSWWVMEKRGHGH